MNTETAHTQHTETTVTPAPAAAPAAPKIPGMLGNTPDFIVPGDLLKPAPIAPLQPDIIDIIASALASGYATDVRGASLVKDVYATALHLYQYRDAAARKAGIGAHEMDIYDQFALSVISGTAARGAVVADEVWLQAAQYVDARRRRGF
jgi:hypothetical protein